MQYIYLPMRHLKKPKDVPRKTKGEATMPSREASSYLITRGDIVQFEVHFVQFLFEKRNSMHEVPGKT